MANLERKSKIQISIDEVLRGVAQLDTSELEKFLDEISSLLAERKRQEFAEREAELLGKIKQGYPVELKKRFDSLSGKMKTGKIFSEEYQELITISNRFEELDAERLQWLIEFSKIRNQSLDQLLKETNIQPPSPSPA